METVGQSAKSEGADQTAQMRSLISAFTVRIHFRLFSVRRSSCIILLVLICNDRFLSFFINIYLTFFLLFFSIW